MGEKWHVTLSGDQGDLKELAKSCTKPEISVIERNREFCLESSDFTSADTSDSISQKAALIVAQLNGACRLALTSLTPLRYTVHKLREDGTRVSFTGATVALVGARVTANVKVIRADGTVEEISQADPIPLWMSLARSNPKVASVLELLSADDWSSWVGLYRIFEDRLSSSSAAGAVGGGAQQSIGLALEPPSLGCARSEVVDDQERVLGDERQDLIEIRRARPRARQTMGGEPGPEVLLEQGSQGGLEPARRPINKHAEVGAAEDASPPSSSCAPPVGEDPGGHSPRLSGRAKVQGYWPVVDDGAKRQDGRAPQGIGIFALFGDSASLQTGFRGRVRLGAILVPASAPWRYPRARSAHCVEARKVFVFIVRWAVSSVGRAADS